MESVAIMWDWLSLAVRWLHVITAISWIGSSFYFIALDLGLRKHAGLPDGVRGEEWQVHGGGFYHIQKYLVAPDNLPEHVTWFKWESYATWLSGFAMLVIVYYAGADLYMIDPAVMSLNQAQAVLLSLLSLVLGWVIYDRLCKSPIGKSPTGLMVLFFLLLVAMAWGYTQVFSGRAAFIHLGAFTATIMSANVFLVIIPNQKIVVADMKAGLVPDAKYGIIAKQRSTHNNYLTLPVLFFMLSNHYPLAFASGYNWLIAALVFLMGVTIRHYFNTVHARAGNPVWTWAVTAVLFILAVFLSSFPPTPKSQSSATTPLYSKTELAYLNDPRFEAVRDVVQTRCVMCHAQDPLWQGIYRAPKGVKFESDADIVAHAREIYLQAGLTNVMPPANVSFIEPSERALIKDWFEKRGFDG